jgi:hypothetical protein
MQHLLSYINRIRNTKIWITLVISEVLQAIASRLLPAKSYLLIASLALAGIFKCDLLLKCLKVSHRVGDVVVVVLGQAEVAMSIEF